MLFNENTTDMEALVTRNVPYYYRNSQHWIVYANSGYIRHYGPNSLLLCHDDIGNKFIAENVFMVQNLLGKVLMSK